MTFKKFASVAVAVFMSAGILSLAACSDDEGEVADTPCTHSIVKVEPKDADCLEYGYYAHYKCTLCGELFSDSKGVKTTTEDKIRIDKLAHSMQVQNETVGNYTKFYYCGTCGHYYEDGAGKTEIPYSELVDSSVTPVTLNELHSDGNILTTKSYNSSSEFDDIDGDFTIRMFVGWKSADGKSIDEFPTGQKVQVNINLNRLETTKPNPPDDIWYNFGIAYSQSEGLSYKRFSPSNASAKPEFNSLFVENGGIYIRVVRKGTNVSFYFEDKYGMPRLIDSDNRFAGSGTLVRLAANSAVKTDGWNVFVEDAAICLGIANPRCDFTTD